tara:strand:+ start:1118 stop:2311 length:1194 start_codon:yes stop_codon:yes gene_type:complete
MKIYNCHICKKKLTKILDLNRQPPANSIYKKKKPKVFPLILSFCKPCSLLQLTEFPSKKYLFNKYFWVTGTSAAAKNFAKIFYKKLSKSINKNSNIFEIASNDGTFLKEFNRNKHNILGIDPAKNIAKIANSKGIKTIPDFFNYKKSIKIKKFYQPDLIFARNVIPHVSDLKSVIKGISNLCKKNTKVVIEFHYAGYIYKELQYDSIYHEHIFYFTIESLSKIFHKYGLYPNDLFVSPISGGSLVLIFDKSKKIKSNNLKKFIKYENKIKLNQIDTWKFFSQRVKIHKDKFKKQILDKFKVHGRFFAYGASARSSTLLNYAKIDNRYIDFIIDQNKLKEGYYTPGTGIKILRFDKVSNLIKKYKFMLLLAWNFKDEVKKFLSKKKFKGEILVPLKKK